MSHNTGNERTTKYSKAHDIILQVTPHAHHNSVFRLTVSLVAIVTLYDRKGKNRIEHETTEQNSLLPLAKQSNLA